MVGHCPDNKNNKKIIHTTSARHDGDPRGGGVSDSLIIFVVAMGHFPFVTFLTLLEQ